MKDLIRSFAATAVIQVANIASGIMLARILLPTGRGELAAAMLWPPLVATIGLLGIAEATAFCAARRLNSPGHIFAAGITLALTLSMLLLPIGWLVVNYVAVGLSPAGREAAILYLAFIPLNHIGLVVVAMHQGSLSITRWNILRASVHVVFSLLIPVVYFFHGPSIVGFAAASLAANAFVTALGLALARKREWFGVAPKLDDISTLLKFGLKVHVANAIAMLNERTDQLVISLLLSPTNLGIYVVAATVARGVSAVGDTLAVLVFPKVAHAKDRTTQALTACRYARGALMLSIPAVALGIAISHWLIVMVFGAGFAPAADIVQVLLLSIIPLNVKAVLSAVLKGANRGLEAGAGQAAALVLSLVLLSVLLPAFGLKGAAYAALFTQLGAALVMADRVRRSLNLSFKDQLLPNFDDVVFVLDTLRSYLRNRSSGGTHLEAGVSGKTQKHAQRWGIKLEESWAIGLLARVGLQPLWSFLYKVALAGMGYMNADPRSNGEDRFLSRWADTVRSKFSRPVVVLDIGANEGDFSLGVKERLENVTVHAFEPHPKTFARLQKRFSNDSRFIVNQAALAATNGQFVLYDFIAEEGTNKASLFGATFENVYPGESRGIEVPAVTIDDYVEANGIEHIDLLKLDIEGGEKAALEGARRTLAAGRVDVIQFEFNAHALIAGFSLLSLSKILEGFDIYRVVTNGLVPSITLTTKYNTRIEIFKYANFVALRRDSGQKALLV